MMTNGSGGTAKERKVREYSRTTSEQVVGDLADELLGVVAQLGGGGSGCATG